MTAPPWPLLDLFLELRRRNLDLGPAEYLDGLQGLIRGEVTSRQQLEWAIQALWGKTLEEQQAIGAMLGSILPRRITPQQLEQLTERARRDESPRATEPGSRRTDDRVAGPEQHSPAAAAPREEEHVELAPLENERAPTVSVAAPAERPREISFPVDLAGELPATRRYMKRSWRYYRRMGKSGPAVVLDVEGCVSRLEREGVLVAPVLVPRRRNLASVLVLVDQGGSMIPFQRWIEAFLEAGRQSGLARFQTLYFRNTPGEHVFHDPVLRQPAELLTALNRLVDVGVLIVSDAGAARGRLSQQRVLQTKHFLQRTGSGGRRVVWLNPVPAARWAGTTAGQVVRELGVAMFPMDRSGLDAAMFALRGRVS